MKHAVRVDKLPSPATAWPTVWLGVAGLALWTCSAFAGWQYDAPMVFTVPVSAVAVYLTFTPMHDASHRSVSKQHRWLNELVGWACSLVYLVVPFPLFRLVHLTHHKHTNDPDLDPDYIPPIHGVLVTLHLLFGNVPRYVRCAWKNLDRTDNRNLSLTYLCVSFVFIAYATWSGYGKYLLQIWVLPVIVELPVIGFCFDYAPHHPHRVTCAEDRYGCTNTAGGVFSVGDGDSAWWLTLLMLGQNYHSIHHLFPTVPFYKYSEIWHCHKEEFMRAGVPVVSLLGADTYRHES